MAFGDVDLDLSAVAQLVEASQTRGVVACLQWLEQQLSRGRADTENLSERSLVDLLTDLERELDARGFEEILPHEAAGDLARPRCFEVAAAFNRLRTVQVEQKR